MFNGKRAFLFDVHGVFITRLLDDPEVLGGHEVLRRLKSGGRKVALVASGSNWSTAEYTRRMRELGYDLSEDEVWPAARVAALYLRDVLGKSACFVLGEPGLREELQRHGHEVVDDWRRAEAVVVGHDRQLTFDKLTAAIRAVNRGAFFVAVNKVRWYYMPDEGPILSPGAIVAAIEYQTKREAVVVGKPSLIHFIYVLNSLGVTPRDAVMVGDDIEADILPAKSLGISTVWITGVKRWDSQEAPPRAVDLALPRVDDLVKYL